MQTYRFVMRPLTAFGSPLAGDTLFGQFCWALRRAFGEARLTALLEGYTDGKPFTVFSDGFPCNFLPLPHLPSFFWDAPNDEDRKKTKSKVWIARKHVRENLAQWQRLALDTGDAYRETGGEHATAPLSRMQPHNTVNRLSGTTGEGAFAPYSKAQIWHHPETRLDIYVTLDETRLEKSELYEVMTIIGKTGYGCDTSVGLGKFVLEGGMEIVSEWADAAAAFLTLAPCAPQGLGYKAEASFYQVKTHFGRHGDMMALSNVPFKRPILMARTGAVFSLPEKRQALYLGQGIGQVSRADSRTVHQGYAPAVPLPGLSAILSKAEVAA